MSTTGHEEEFRGLFAQEAEQRLEDLSRQMLELENTYDPELVAAVLREAHTLKGAAAVVGLDAVSVVAHAIENVLDSLRGNERPVTPELVDGVLRAVEDLRAVLPDLLAGEDRTARASEIVAALGAIELPDEPSSGSGTAPETDGPDRSEAVGLPAVESEAGLVTAGPDAGGETAADDPAPVGSSRALPQDEVVRIPLRRLDELVRLVGESAAAQLRVGRMVGERLGVDPVTLEELRDLSRALNELQERTMRARMVPVSTITERLHRAARDVARSGGKEVRWEVRGGETELDRGVLQQLADPLLHMVRNAVDHGLERPEERALAGKPGQGVVRLHAMQLGSEVIVTVTDDGRGIDVEAVRAEAERRGVAAADLDDTELLLLVFRSGFSTATFLSDVSGRGVGLDVVRSNIESVRGRIEIDSQPGQGTEFRILVPITLAVLPCLLVEAGDQVFALPLHSVAVARDDAPVSSAEGRAVVEVGNRLVALSDLATTLGFASETGGPVVVLNGPTRRHAFRVARIVGQREVVVKELSRLLPRLDVLSGASVEPDGSILLVLDVPGLIDRARSTRAGPLPIATEPGPTAHTQAAGRRGTLLVVDDALTIRELQRSILQRAGYAVVTAIDGVDALARLTEAPIDLVLTDIEMPRMDGFALTEAIRNQPAQANVPVLILTSRASDDDRRRGLDVGADGYLVKSAFDEAQLLDAVERLLGR